MAMFSLIRCETLASRGVFRVQLEGALPMQRGSFWVPKCLVDVSGEELSPAVVGL